MFCFIFIYSPLIGLFKGPNSDDRYDTNVWKYQSMMGGSTLVMKSKGISRNPNRLSILYKGETDGVELSYAGRDMTGKCNK